MWTIRVRPKFEVANIYTYTTACISQPALPTARRAHTALLWELPSVHSATADSSIERVMDSATVSKLTKTFIASIMIISLIIRFVWLQSTLIS